MCTHHSLAAVRLKDARGQEVLEALEQHKRRCLRLKGRAVSRMRGADGGQQRRARVVRAQDARRHVSSGGRVRIAGRVIRGAAVEDETHKRGARGAGLACGSIDSTHECIS
jgi:hypothetical protein